MPRFSHIHLPSRQRLALKDLADWNIGPDGEVTFALLSTLSDGAFDLGTRSFVFNPATSRTRWLGDGAWGVEDFATGRWTIVDGGMVSASLPLGSKPLWKMGGILGMTEDGMAPGQPSLPLRVVLNDDNVRVRSAAGLDGEVLFRLSKGGEGREHGKRTLLFRPDFWYSRGMGIPPLRRAATFAAALLLGTLPPASLPSASLPSASPSVIRVVCDNNYPPYAMTTAEGTLEGIVPDQWRAFEKATGIKVELRGLPWSEALDAFDSGRADVIDTIFQTPARDLRYYFTPAYATIEVPVFIHKSISGLASIEDLRGFKVAVKAGDAAIGALKSQGVSDLTEYPGYKEIIDAAARLDTRIFCVDKPPAMYFLYKAGIDSDFRIAFTLSPGAFHRAVLRERPELLSILTEGFAAIPSKEFSAIDSRWLGSPLTGTPDLRLIGLTFAAVLALVAILIGVAAGLRRRVDRATAELREKVVQLEASEERNRAFIAALPDIFLTTDREGTYIDVSTSSPDLLVMPPEQLQGKRIRDIGMPPATVQKLMDALGEAIDQRRLSIVDYELGVPAGRKIFEARFVPLGQDHAILVARDITEQKLQEERLRSSLAEKEILLKEVHHRVKNNIQIISSLIHLQSFELRDEMDRELVAETQQRIHAMAQLHELLYRSTDLASIGAAEYLEAISRELGVGHDRRGIELEAEDAPLDIDDALALGLISNELIINALKYAYPAGADGRIGISFGKRGDRLVLRVEDGGKGLPAGVDPLESQSMGFTIVRALASQAGGELRFGGPPGFSAEFWFPPRE